jgi:acyl carrier protein
MEKFNEIASKSFGIPLTDIKDSLTPKDISEWDSMNYLLFIAELEKQCNISFSMDEVLNAQSLGDVRKALQTKI